LALDYFLKGFLMSIRLFLLAVVLCAPFTSQASCTYTDVQQKGMALTNLQAALSREQISYVQRSEEAPAALVERIDALLSDATKIGQEVAALVEPQALTIKADSAMEASLCKRYDDLLAKHAPEGSVSAPITLSAATPFGCDKVDTAALWQRYGDAIKAQTDLFQSGRMNKAQTMALSQKFSTFGTQMSTDPAAACATFQEIEGELAGYAK
jgi:hypothetical protein